MKKIDTLIDDIESVIYGLGGWTRSIALNLGQNIGISANKRFSKPQEPRGYLSLSSVGTPCKRKLWYKVNQPEIGEPLSANLLLRFFYGDMIEELVLAMVRASGHKLEGSQDRLDVHGIRGHRDCIIDGMTVDVKSCSSYAFKKFKEGSLRDNDAFGYISQLSSYVYAGKDDPLVTDKTHGAFLAVDKVSGEMCLDVHGIRGHRDCIIDGMTVDVKSCSSYAFKKFKEGSLRDNDAFGYISQLSSYVYAGKDDPLVKNKTHGAFLAVDKVSGEMCLDVYDFTKDLETKKAEMLAAKELVAGDLPADRIQPVPAGKNSPNTKLDKSCQFCEYKKVCWPNLRQFQYSYGVEYLVHVEKEPKVPEITNVKSS